MSFGFGSEIRARPKPPEVAESGQATAPSSPAEQKATEQRAEQAEIAQTVSAQQQMIGQLSDLLLQKEKGEAAPSGTMYVQSAAAPAAAPKYLLYAALALAAWLLFKRKGKLL